MKLISAAIDPRQAVVEPKDCVSGWSSALPGGPWGEKRTFEYPILTHIPTGIVVQCQNDRSQHRNRDEAWQMLRSRLYEHEMRKQREAQQKLEDSKTDVGWGHQIQNKPL